MQDSLSCICYPKVYKKIISKVKAVKVCRHYKKYGITQLKVDILHSLVIWFNKMKLLVPPS